MAMAPISVTDEWLERQRCRRCDPPTVFRWIRPAWHTVTVAGEEVQYATLWLYCPNGHKHQTIPDDS